MQHFSLLSLEGGPIQGILDCHNVHSGYTGLINQEAFNQERYMHQAMPFPTFEENPPAMDELLEHFLSYSELGGLNKEPLDQGFESSILDLEKAHIISHDESNLPLLNMPSMAGGFLEKIQQNVSLGRNNQVTLDLTSDGHYTDDNLLLVSQQNGFPSDDHVAGCSASIESDSSFSSLQMHPSSSMINSAMLGSSSIMSNTPTICAVPHFQMVSGYTVPETLDLQPESTVNQMHLLGKRYRDHQISMNESTSPSPGFEKLIDLTGVEKLGRFQIGRNISQPNAQDITAASQAISNQSHGSEAGGHQLLDAEPKIVASAGEPLRPRARARRGQATDPHSIAERLRRERISDRMKCLQELVPNANKTDKASMLDEIIEYVKFLQLQVKVLSMSRLGSAKAITPTVADLQSEGLNEIGLPKTLRGGGNIHPSEDPAGLTERQIAKLMEEDMGTAMQYLQTKGLCLMPIALANAMSSKTKSGDIGTDLTKAAAVAQHTIAAAGIGDMAENSIIDLVTIKKFFGDEKHNAPSDSEAIRTSKETSEVKHKEKTYPF